MGHAPGEDFVHEGADRGEDRPLPEVGGGEERLRLEVLLAARRLRELGLVEGTAGNVSARVDADRVWVTASGVDYRGMEERDIVLVDLEGRALFAAAGPPSSEAALHLACYRAFPEVGAVVHSHPVEASAFAAARRPIPVAVDEFALYVGGEVPVTAYGRSGTASLGQRAVEVLGRVGAALLANHGLVALGPTPDAAVEVSVLVERAARVVRAAVALGGPQPLPDEDLEYFSTLYRRRRAAWPRRW